MRYFNQYSIICYSLLILLLTTASMAVFDPVQVMAAGDQYYAQARYSEATKPYLYFIENFPDNPKREQAYYSLIKCYLQSKKWSDLLSTSAAMQKDYPQGADVMQCRVWVFRADLELGKGTDANAIFDDMTNNNAGPELCWQLIEQSFIVKSDKDPAHAVGALDAFMQQHLDVLPTDAIQRAAWLRLAFYKKSDVTKYLNEAINMLNGAKEVATKDGQAPYVDLASRLYRPLVAARRIEDAQQAQQTVQAMIALIQPVDKDLLAKDQQSYVQALQYGISLIDALRVETTADKYLPAITFSAPLFRALLTAQQADSARHLHDSMRVVLNRLQNPYALCHQLHTNYAQAEIATLNPTQLPALADTTVTNLQQAANGSDYGEPANLAQCLYAPLLGQANMLPKASALHDAILAESTRLALPVQWSRDDNTAYLAALAAALPVEYLSAALKTIRGTNVDNTPATTSYLVDCTGKLYGQLLDVNRLDDLLSIRIYLQKIILATPGVFKAMGTLDNKNYLSAVDTTIANKLFKIPLSDVQKAALRQVYLATWQDDPATTLARVTPFVRDQAVHDAHVADWVKPYASLVNSAAKDDPQMLPGQLVLGQLSHTAALQTMAFGQQGTLYLTQAADAYQKVLAVQPTGALGHDAFTGLMHLYETTYQARALLDLLNNVQETSQLIDPLTWVATYYLRSGTGVGAQQAMTVLNRLLTLDPTNAQGGIWRFQLGVCLEHLQRPDEALAAYQKVIELYPDSSCTLAAIWKIQQLKGAK